MISTIASGAGLAEAHAPPTVHRHRRGQGRESGTVQPPYREVEVGHDHPEADPAEIARPPPGPPRTLNRARVVEQLQLDELLPTDQPPHHAAGVVPGRELLHACRVGAPARPAPGVGETEDLDEGPEGAGQVSRAQRDLGQVGHARPPSSNPSCGSPAPARRTSRAHRGWPGRRGRRFGVDAAEELLDGDFDLLAGVRHRDGGHGDDFVGHVACRGVRADRWPRLARGAHRRGPALLERRRTTAASTRRVGQVDADHEAASRISGIRLQRAVDL